MDLKWLTECLATFLAGYLTNWSRRSLGANLGLPSRFLQAILLWLALGSVSNCWRTAWLGDLLTPDATSDCSCCRTDQIWHQEDTYEQLVETTPIDADGLLYVAKTRDVVCVVEGNHQEYSCVCWSGHRGPCASWIEEFCRKTAQGVSLTCCHPDNNHLSYWRRDCTSPCEQSLHAEIAVNELDFGLFFHCVCEGNTFVLCDCQPSLRHCQGIVLVTAWGTGPFLSTVWEGRETNCVLAKMCHLPSDNNTSCIWFTNKHVLRTG